MYFDWLGTMKKHMLSGGLLYNAVGMVKGTINDVWCTESSRIARHLLKRSTESMHNSFSSNLSGVLRALFGLLVEAEDRKGL
jgi:hypothetical protein